VKTHRLWTIIPLTLLLLFQVVPSRAGSTGTVTVASLQQDSPGNDAASDEMRYASRTMRVQVWHDKDEDEPYDRGEPLRIYFQADQDCYVVLYRIDADGFTEVLWPSSRYDDGFVFGGHTYTVPSRGTEVRLRASNSKGVEYVEALASQYPYDLRQLGIDFRFDPTEDGRYQHQVAGDPFLAVNDINYAITGLEEDVDWMVTDWTHIYVESKVDYPRYACTQCHVDQEEHYQPYVETCTQVQIYQDWGWHRGWYVRFGYYPLYYDAPYYYWDTWYSRPYYFCYYPVPYYWPAYPVYVRPYPVYSWRSHEAYRGDYVVLYDRGRVHAPPLYDNNRTLAREVGKERGPTRTPPSVARRSLAGEERGRVRADELVRNGMPERDGRREPRTLEDRARLPRAGVRTDQERSPRAVRSLRPDRPELPEKTRDTLAPRSGEPSSRQERRWTRPVIRNSRPEAGPREGTVRSPAGGLERRSGDVRRPTSSEGDRSSGRVQPRREVRPSTPSREAPRREVRPSTPSREAPRREVRPPQRRDSPPPRQGSGEVRSAPRSGGGSRVSPPPARSAPPPRSKATPRSNGGSSRRGGRG
jgi:hypothetical protein